MTDVLATLPEPTLQRLHLLLDEVLRVNQQFNLTAVRDPDEAWVKHIVDSLQGLNTKLFEGKQHVIDIGAGAGFPGLPLAVARPKLELVSLEATRKKCEFIKATGEKLGLNARVICDRAEIVGQDKVHREKYQIATARAVGSLSEVCELALPQVEVGGHLVLWRGEKAHEELASARSALKKLGGGTHQILPYHLPGHSLNYHLLVIQKVAPTPSQFPRRVGLPKQRPL